jgi:TRAP-type mannitol/chloroaromatic compound transport system permease large subunit
VEIPQGSQLIKKVVKTVVPPILLIFAVLGTILFGVATPTEAGAVGGVGASILAVFNKRLRPQLIRDTTHSIAVIRALVLMILFCSSMFSLVFDALGGKTLITNLLKGLPGGYWGFQIISNLAIFALGVFLEFMEICFIAMPLFLPAAQALNIDMVWFGEGMAINLQTAFISPPVGFSLFYLQVLPLKR